MIVIKRAGLPVNACRLGEDNPLEAKLIREGRLRRLTDNAYEVFTRESGDKAGERAAVGDFVKVDWGGWPYPVRAEDFLADHVLRDGGYVQIPRPLKAWSAECPPSEELRWALEHGRLTLDEKDPAHYFRAELWGTVLTAPRDAVLLLYRIERDAAGQITDMDFNFVVREEFAHSYRVLEP